MTSGATRPLRAAERVLLDWLLDTHFSGRDALHEQARLAQVRTDDPSPPWKSYHEFDVVAFEVDPRTPRYRGRWHVPVGADSVEHGSEVQVMLMVDVRAGRLFSIRVMDVTDGRSRWAAELPRPEDFGPPYPNAVVEM
jgi:hypothetical protein